MNAEQKYAALAALRLGMPAEEIARILGEEWIPPGPESLGYFQLIHYERASRPKPIFGVRITTAGEIGRINYYGGFPEDVDLAGLKIGMALDDIRRRYPEALPDPVESSPAQGVTAWRANLPERLVVIAKMKQGRLIAVEFERSGSVYPGDDLLKLKAAGPIRAYDLEMLPRFVDPASNQGWVFGLPPGIRTEQWPLDPVSGYPLMHGFTLRLPEGYRVHGPEIVAFSFFATASEHNDGGAVIRDDLFAAVNGALPTQRENEHLKPFRKHAAKRHQRLFRMQDVLDYEYAVILLTAAEFRGLPCQPPAFGDNHYLDPRAKPNWLTQGSAYACFAGHGGTGANGRIEEASFGYQLFGAVPEKRLDWHRAIAATPRAGDPNAGIAPVEVDPEQTALLGDYQPFFLFEDGEIGADHYRLQPWAESHKPNHIGGTMRPMQATPAFSPYYVEFEEYFGDYNFGGGNAQLDFLRMKFDWACG